MSRHRSGAAGGFTLLELVLVLFVIALAALVVYPDLSPMLESVRFESSVRKTTAFLDGTRTRAVLSNDTLVVALAEDGRGLVATPEGPEEESVDELAVETGPVEELTLEPEALRYYPQGSSSGGKVIFKGDGRVLRTIRVGSFTGLARVVEGDGP